MKSRNAVVGMQVQVKRNCHGHSNEVVTGGLICTVSRIGCLFGSGYELRLTHPDIDLGFAWVNASDVRQYKEEVPVVQVPEEPQDDIKVGDSVLVGAEGAGNGYVLKEYAGLVCLVVGTYPHDDRVAISHPSVMHNKPYTSCKKYLTKVTPKPKTLTLQDVQVGDWVVYSGVSPNLVKGVAYEVVGFTTWGSLLINNPSWGQAKRIKGYAVKPCWFNKILIEVNNATS